MRTENTIKNSIVAIITNGISIIIGMIAQAIFLKQLGAEYLGINGLFSNIISMLGIIELGLGSTIIYHLYKPIAEQDIERIKTLMGFYKKCYRIIAVIVAIIGIILLPFVHIFVGEISININIYLIFGLFLIDSVCSYLLTYKRSILYANQKTYIVNIVHIGYIVFMNLIQIIILMIFKNYILYLIIKIIFRILENIIISIIANKKYSYITEKNNQDIDKLTLEDIKIKIKGLLFHKISAYVVNSTSNIVISIFLGVATVGLYSNYNLIINALNTIINQVFSSIVASVGNLLTENQLEKNIKTYDRMLFINFWIAMFCAISYFCLIQPFITIWVGKEYLLGISVIATITILFFLQTMRKTLNCFKEAKGIFYEDRMVAIAEAIINIVVSVLMVNMIGLTGVLIGPIVGHIYILTYAYPKYTYVPIFKKDVKGYLLSNLKYLLIFLVLAIITYGVTMIFEFDNIILQLIYNAIICVIVPNVLLIMIFRKSDEFKYVKDLSTNLIKNCIKKLKNKE